MYVWFFFFLSSSKKLKIPHMAGIISDEITVFEVKSLFVTVLKGYKRTHNYCRFTSSYANTTCLLPNSSIVGYDSLYHFENISLDKFTIFAIFSIKQLSAQNHCQRKWKSNNCHCYLMFSSLKLLHNITCHLMCF